MDLVVRAFFHIAVASLLSYVGQEARLPESALQMWPVLLARIFRLPMHRILQWVFVQLRDVGFWHAPQDIVRTHLAAVARG